MSTPENTGNAFYTPESSPDATESELQSLETALERFGQNLNETVEYFNEYYDHWQELEDSVFLPDVELTGGNKVSIPAQKPRQAHHSRSVENLVRHYETINTNTRTLSYFTSDLPLFRIKRSISKSLSSQGRLSSISSSITEVGIDHQVTGNMVSPARQPSGRGTPTQEPLSQDIVEPTETTEWSKFKHYGRSTMHKIHKESTDLREKIRDTTLSGPALNCAHHKVNRWLAKLIELENDSKGIRMTSEIPQGEFNELNNDIEDLTGDLEMIVSIIDQLLKQLREDEDPKQAFVEAIKDGLKDGLQNVANSPTVNLPKYAGDTTKFRAFRKNFEFVIKSVKGPKELWATHLISCLEGPVMDYIGSADNWFDKYDELWNHLEDKYANKWTLNCQTINKFFSKVLTSDEPEVVKTYFYDQLDNMASLLALNLTPEQICINLVIQALPLKHRTVVRDALRAKHPGENKAVFTAEEVRKAFNDTIGTITEESEERNVSTLSFKSQITNINSTPQTKGLTKNDDIAATNTTRTNGQNPQEFQQINKDKYQGEYNNGRSSRYDRHVQFNLNQDNSNSRNNSPKSQPTNGQIEVRRRDSRSPSQERNRYGRSPNRDSRYSYSPSRDYNRYNRSPKRENERRDISPNRGYNRQGNNYGNYNRYGRSPERYNNEYDRRSNDNYREDRNYNQEDNRPYRSPSRSYNERQYQAGYEYDTSYRYRNNDRSANFRNNNYQNERGYRGRGRGSYRGRGGNSYGSTNKFCYICLDDSRFSHSSYTCPNYPTAADKRKFLEETNRCNCCAYPKHQGECSQSAHCLIHNEKHFTYLCSGAPHPGKNA